MTVARRSRSARKPEPRFGGLLLASLGGHLLLVMVLGLGWPAPPRDGGPLPITVDLVHKPVLNPQAGRPEPRQSTPPAATVPADTATKPSVASAKTAPAAKVPDKSADHQLNGAMQKLRDERALQERMATLRQGQAVPIDVPVGLPDAKGNEAGVTSLVYVQAFIQQQWALSPYTLADPSRLARIEAWVRITYGKNGRLESFRFEKESASPQFDESIKRALLKSQQLPNTLPVRLEDIRVIFNLRELKALAEARR